MIGRRHAEQGWRHRAAAAAILVTALTTLFLALAAATGRWWAGFLAHAVHAEPATGAILGFCAGALFTLVPATLAWVLTRGQIPWTTRAPWLVAAAALAAPNLMTLGVTLGRGPAAADGRRTLDSAAPMFRGATLTGTAAAMLTVLAMMIAFRYRDAPSRRRLPAPTEARLGSARPRCTNAYAHAPGARRTTWIGRRLPAGLGECRPRWVRVGLPAGSRTVPLPLRRSGRARGLHVRLCRRHVRRRRGHRPAHRLRPGLRRRLRRRRGRCW